MADAGDGELGPEIPLPAVGLPTGLVFLLGAMNTRLGLVLKTQSEDRDAAAQHRTRLYDKMDGMKLELGTTSADVKTANHQISELKANFDSIESRLLVLEKAADRSAGSRATMVGLAKGVQFLWGAIGAGVALLAQRYLSGGSNGPH